MAEQYQIQAVSGETRDFSSQFGAFRSYKLKLRGIQSPVELSQKVSSPAPQEGDVLTGDIIQGKFGPKFKKEYQQGGFTERGTNPGFGSPSSTSAPKSSGNSKGYGGRDDTYTMYLSYAKDLAVALVATKEGFDADKYAQLLEDVVAGGKTLYDERPGKKEREQEEVNQMVDRAKDFFSEPDKEEKPFEPSAQDMAEARELFD